MEILRLKFILLHSHIKHSNVRLNYVHWLVLKYKERWLAAEREKIRIVLLNRARAKKEQRVYFFGIFI